MLNSAYPLETFLSKFSKKNTVLDAINLVKASKDTNIQVEIVIPRISWNVKTDQFTHMHAMLLSTLEISGCRYESSKRANIEALGALDFEDAFLNALKESVLNTQKIVD